MDNPSNKSKQSLQAAPATAVANTGSPAPSPTSIYGGFPAATLTVPPTSSYDAEREAFLAEIAKGYAALHSNPTAWAEHRSELALWDTTSNDGLEDE
jgi:hypothetical protein